MAIKTVALLVAIASLIGLGTSGTIGLWVVPAIVATMVFLAVPSGVAVNVRGVSLVSAVLVWLGDRSYSIYLWHWPLLALLIWRNALGPLPIVVALVATLVASDLSFRFIEQGRWPSRAGF